MRAGIGALLPFLPLHMRAAGLTAREARVVSAAAPLTGLLGPLVAALLLHRRRAGKEAAAKEAGAQHDAAPLRPGQQPRQDGEEGKKLRFLLAFTVLGAAVCYSALLLLPSVTWYPVSRYPAPQRLAPLAVPARLTGRVYLLQARRPSVSFSCNGSGAAVLQERCMEPACYHWPEQEVSPGLTAANKSHQLNINNSE